MRDVLLVLWLATLGADRIDLLGGSGPFIFTPFLLLTPIVLTAEVLSLLGRGGRFRLPAGAAQYLLLTVLFLALALVGVIFSAEVGLAGKRYVLLAIQVLSTFAMVVMLSDRPRPGRVLVAGAYAGMTLGLVFNVIQVLIWLDGGAAEPGMPG
jgi:hypothetical protein